MVFVSELHTSRVLSWFSVPDLEHHLIFLFSFQHVKNHVFCNLVGSDSVQILRENHVICAGIRFKMSIRENITCNVLPSVISTIMCSVKFFGSTSVQISKTLLVW